MTASHFPRYLQTNTGVVSCLSRTCQHISEWRFSVRGNIKGKDTQDFWVSRVSVKAHWPTPLANWLFPSFLQVHVWNLETIQHKGSNASAPLSPFIFDGSYPRPLLRHNLALWSHSNWTGLRTMVKNSLHHLESYWHYHLPQLASANRLEFPKFSRWTL